jgi:hypothetical protein
MINERLPEGGLSSLLIAVVGSGAQTLRASAKRPCEHLLTML